MKKSYLVDVATYYKGLPHQKEAVDYLEDFVGEPFFEMSVRELMQEQAELPEDVLNEFKRLWDNDPKPPKKSLSTLPYNTQLDNPVKPHYTCNSSSHYMFARSVKPSLPASDSQYVRDVMSGKFGYGHTNNPSIYWSVHTKGLLSLGIKSGVRSGSFNKAIAQTKKGILTPVNIAHRGHISNPKNGHVVCLAGISDDGTKLFIHDPYGELNYISGTSNLNASGKYWVTKQRFLKRHQGNWTEFHGLV